MKQQDSMTGRSKIPKKIPKVIPPGPPSRAPLPSQPLFPSTNVEIDIRPPFELRPSFTGRSEIITGLAEILKRSIADSALGFALLLGEAGMGKSRTLRQFSEVVKDCNPEVRVLVGNCKSSDRTYAAMAMLLSARFGILLSDSHDAAHAKIEAGVAEVMAEARVIEVSHLLAHLMGRPYVNSEVVTPLAQSHQQLEVRTFLALKRFCQADANAGPMVLFFEDLEQADPSTINLLHFLASGLSSSPILIIGTGTGLLYQNFPNFGDSEASLETFSLGPLSPTESISLCRQLCRTLANVPETIIEHAAQLGGSPRAIFEVIRFLLEAEVIVRSRVGWTVDLEQLSHTPLPKTHDDLVEARILAMPEENRRVLHRASVVGEIFWLDAIVALIRAETFASDDPDGPTLADIAAAGDHTKAIVSRALGQLLTQEWLVEVVQTSKAGEREFRFANPLLWSRVYDDCLASTREAAHLRCAQWLELRPNGLDPVAQEDIGRHLELAGNVRGAATCYRRAADNARRHFFNDRAIALYGHALDCLGHADQAARIQLWHDLGSVYELKGDYDAAIGAFERMLRLSWICASRTKAAVAFNKMGRVWRKRGDLKLSLDYLQRGQKLFEQAGDERGVAGSLDDVGQVQYLLGNFEEAHANVTEGLQRRGKGGDSRAIATSLSTLGNIQQDRGYIDEALTCHREALNLRQKTGDRAGVAASLNNLAVIAYERGALGEARDGWERALKEAEKIGALPLQAHVLTNLGEIALVEARYDEARRRLTEGVQIASEIAERRIEVEASRNMARLEHLVGNVLVAREHAHRAYIVAADAGLRDYEGRALLTLAEVFGGALFDAESEDKLSSDSDQGATSAEMTISKAETYFQQGIDLMREVGNETELAKGLESYGRYKVEQGQTSAGRSLLAECLAIYKRLDLRQRDEVQRVLASI